MKNWKLWGIAVAATIASLGLLYGLIRSIICKGVVSSEAAGWVQAIGAIVALAVAIGLAKYQQLQDVTKAKEEAQKYQHDMTVLCYLFCDEFCRFLEREKSRLKLNEAGNRFAVDERALEEFRVQFRDLPVHTFNIDLLSHVLAFRRQVNEIQGRYSHDVSAETRAEMSDEMILADERNRLAEYLHRTRAYTFSIGEYLAGRGWRDPDGLRSAVPKPFRPKEGETK